MIVKSYLAYTIHSIISFCDYVIEYLNPCEAVFPQITLTGLY